METKTVKKVTAFRLEKKLIDKLKIEAKKQNRSLNNYVECVLMDKVYNMPNDTTIDAINEARKGKYAGTLDMKNFDAFMSSINDIE